MIGAGIASEFRNDLAELGVGAGDHGFSITYDIPVDAADLDEIEVFATSPSGEVLRLERAPAGVSPSMPVAVVDADDAVTDRASRAAEAELELRALPSGGGARPNPAPAVAGPRHDPVASAEQAEREFQRLTGEAVDAAMEPEIAAEVPAVAEPAEAERPSGGPIIAATFLRRDGNGDDGSDEIGMMVRRAPPQWDKLKIFVLGAARSGTSAMFSALTDVLELPGFGESHVIPAFQRMIYQLRVYVELFKQNPEDIMIKRMGSSGIEALLHQYARDFYWTSYDGAGFVDKTPTGEAIFGGPLLEEIFPDAHLVVMRRTGIEVVTSFRIKFSSAFEEACQAWADAMSGILRARPICRRMMEIDQYEMANAPLITGRKLAQFLGRMDKADALGRYFASTRVEKSSTHDWSQRQTLDDVNWSLQDKETFLRICCPMMDAFGYPM